MSFGRHLRALREGAGLSRAEAARRARVPASTLRDWENDRGFPGLGVVVRLAEALGVPVERLAEGVGDPDGDGAGRCLLEAAPDSAGEAVNAPTSYNRHRRRPNEAPHLTGAADRQSRVQHLSRGPGR